VESVREKKKGPKKIKDFGRKKKNLEFGEKRLKI